MRICCLMLMDQCQVPRVSTWTEDQNMASRPIQPLGALFSFPQYRLSRSGKLIYYPTVIMSVRTMDTSHQWSYNSNIILFPLEADLQVVVLNDQLVEILHDHIAFYLRYLVYMTHVVADCIDALPASDWIGANRRVNRNEVIADILWSTSLGRKKLWVFIPERVDVDECSGEGVEIWAHWGRYTVVHLTSWSP